MGHFNRRRHFTLRQHISSELLRQCHIKRINPNLAKQKVSFIIFVSFSVRVCFVDVFDPDLVFAHARLQRDDSVDKIG